MAQKQCHPVNNTGFNRTWYEEDTRDFIKQKVEIKYQQIKYMKL